MIFNVYLYSLEVTRPETYEQLRAEATSLRSNTSWMADLPYGFSSTGIQRVCLSQESR